MTRIIPPEEAGVDAASVDAAGAVMHTDVAENDGFMLKTGPEAYEAVKINRGSASDPAVGNDDTEGYSIGSRWFNTTADTEWVCLNASTGAAVWVETTGGGGATPDNVVILDETGSAGGETTFDAAIAALNAIGDDATLLIYPGAYTIDNAAGLTITGARVSIFGMGSISRWGTSIFNPQTGNVLVTDNTGGSTTILTLGVDTEIHNVSFASSATSSTSAVFLVPTGSCTLRDVSIDAVANNVFIYFGSTTNATWHFFFQDCHFNTGSTGNSGLIRMGANQHAYFYDCHVCGNPASSSDSIFAMSAPASTEIHIQGGRWLANNGSGGWLPREAGVTCYAEGVEIGGWDTIAPSLGTNAKTIYLSGVNWISGVAGELVGVNAGANQTYHVLGGNLTEFMPRPGFAFLLPITGEVRLDKGYAITVTAATGTVTAFDDTVDCNRAGVIALTLPKSSTHCTGKIVIHDVGGNASGTNIISLVASGGDTITGAVQTITNAYGSLILSRNTADTGWNVAAEASAVAAGFNPDNVVYLDETGSAGGETTIDNAVTALNALGDGSTLIIYPGTYTTSSVLTFTGKNITVYAPGGPLNTVISTSSAAGVLFDFTGAAASNDGVRIEGVCFRVTGAIGNYTCVLQHNIDAPFYVHNTHIDGGSIGTNLVELRYMNVRYPRITDCRFYNPNRSGNILNIKSAAGKTDGYMKRTYFEGNGLNTQWAIYSPSGSGWDFTISDCDFVFGSPGGTSQGIAKGRPAGGNTYLIQDCRINGADWISSPVAGDTHIIDGCTFTGAAPAFGVIADNAVAVATFKVHGGDVLDTMGITSTPDTNTSGTYEFDHGYTKGVTSASSTISAWYDRVECNRAGTIALTLPTAAKHCTGRILISDVGGNASPSQAITITRGGTDTFSGPEATSTTSFIIDEPFGSVLLERNASDNGWIISSYDKPSERVHEYKWENFDDLFNHREENGWAWLSGADPQALNPAPDTAQAGGVWQLVTGDADGTVANDGSQMVWQGSPIQLDSSGGNTIVEARLRIKTAITSISVNFGLTDSTLLEEPFTGSADTLTSVATDAVCFVYDDGNTTKEWFSAAVDSDVDDTGNGATGTAPVADIWQILKIEVTNDGATCTFYIDGVQVDQLTAAAGVGPDVPLYPTIVACSTTTTSKTVDVDWVRIKGVR